MQKIRIACNTNYTLNIDQLTPLQGDLKSLSKKDYLKLREEIVETGFAFPIYIWRDEVDGTNYIVGGHQRVRVLTTMRDSGEFEIPPIPIVFVEAANKLQAKRRVLQDVAQYGTVERQGLYEFLEGSMISAEELEGQFKIPDVDLGVFKLEFYGDTTQVSAHERALPGAEEDVPEIQDGEPKTQLGQIFALGSHRLICGDASAPGVMSSLLGLEKVDLLYTDPPYGISLRLGDFTGASSSKFVGKNSEILGDDSFDAATIAIEMGKALQIPRIILWGANYYSNVLPPGMSWLVWDKQVVGDVYSACELAWINQPGHTRKFTHQWHGMIKASERGEARVHPTQKPVALAKWCFEQYAPGSKIVLDLFGGSGSTLIAAQDTDRSCYMVELSRQYCDVIIARWERYTGQKALLIS